jgi:hypothetical protein
MNARRRVETEVALALYFPVMVLVVGDEGSVLQFPHAFAIETDGVKRSSGLRVSVRVNERENQVHSFTLRLGLMRSGAAYNKECFTSIAVKRTSSLASDSGGMRNKKAAYEDRRAAPDLPRRSISATMRVPMEDICPAADKNASVFIRVLHDACLALGGEQKLAEYLGVPLRFVERWLEGRAQPPDYVFLRCIDLLESRNFGELSK